jgi:hypothetical protein
MTWEAKSFHIARVLRKLKAKKAGVKAMAKAKKWKLAFEGSGTNRRFAMEDLWGWAARSDHVRTAL